MRQAMRIVVGALAAGLVLGSVGTFSATAQAQDIQPRRRVYIVTPPTPTPWDYNIIPRYQYRAQDDRVDPCGGPVVPVIRYGSQEVYLPIETANFFGLGRIVGRDWPCGRRR